MNIPSRRVLHPIAAAVGMLLAVTVGNAHEIDGVGNVSGIGTGQLLVADTGSQKHIDAIASRANAELRITATYENHFGHATYKFGELHGNLRPTGNLTISPTCGHCHLSN